jgi:hypothetical protein
LQRLPAGRWGDVRKSLIPEKGGRTADSSDPKIALVASAWAKRATTPRSMCTLQVSITVLGEENQ